MPYKITWEPEGVFIKWSGVATYQENITSNGEIYGNKNFDSIKYQIADFTEAETNQFSDKDISVIAKLESKATIWNKHIRIAHVTIDVELIKQINIYEEILKDTKWEFGIFSTIEDARKWVDNL